MIAGVENCQAFGDRTTFVISALFSTVDGEVLEANGVFFVVDHPGMPGLTGVFTLWCLD